MRGKNTRASRAAPTRRTSAKKEDKARRSQELVAAVSAGSTPSSSGSSDESCGEDQEEGLLKILYAPHDVFMCPFADDIDSSSREMLFDFYTVIKEAMYPVEWCVRFDASKTPWFFWLMMDPAYLHSTLFTVALLNDWVRGTKRSKKTNYHIGKTLKYLNQNLANKDTAVADSTVATIVTVSIVAELFGDHASSTAHVAGLRQIVKLRGGVDSFQHNLQLYAKTCRVDIGWSLITGEMPVYYREKLSYERSFTSILGPCPGGLEPQQGHCPIRSYVDSLDLRLSNIFQDTQDFSRMVNYLFRMKKMDPDKFQALMTSVQYRLIYLKLDDDADIMAEAFRLAMLGFIASLFLHVLGLKMNFIWMTNRFRETLNKVDMSQLSTPAAKTVFAWTLVMGSMTVFSEADDSWLLPKLASVQGSLGQTWPEAKKNLDKVMWINVAHDLKGVQVFGRLVLHVAKIPSPPSAGESELSAADSVFRYAVSSAV
ncbi:hypothetical protein CkaCkLH20_04202 [Colletotrichum karsti]|uniref:Uncharacterized protein n=1 Tax=Colletotrichum karsti TaxID=1095194 RepID=A0A9P6I8F9_9PEZI|nr:uncharacterized protein CkaCkLH20_04202 [Colletotrichum karsti]KAF9878164.1 hypothetical protein CkaCkLH20_04202 [Colletotrichum karsti]